MKNVNTIILSLAATSMTALLAGAHAQETPPSDWPEPVVDYYTGTILFDRFEYTRTDEDENIGVWDMVGWYGGDTYRLYFKSEGENKQNDGEPTDIERAEILASKLIAPYWELQAGLGTRGTLTSESNMENYAVISLYGLAPYQFEMDNSLMINEDGDISFAMEAEYEVRVTQTSYLQPRLAISASLSESERFDRQSGFNSIRLGLRYRYEFSREFAPYVGMYWSKSLGNTADVAELAGEPISETGLVLGARFWF
ncbi:copper resistance protein B [Glaciecola sp.]|jgi:copper resistance protein B|uniref:copper resistance protein B n=1 Tax=Glaciecola sp. MF2-115 TaxID=3384827 RepID=UPI003989C21A